MPSLSTAQQSRGLQPPRKRRMERVVELGKEEPAPAETKAPQELGGSPRHHSPAQAQPRSHLHPNKELLAQPHVPQFAQFTLW